MDQLAREKEIEMKPFDQCPVCGGDHTAASRAEFSGRSRMRTTAVTAAAALSQWVVEPRFPSSVWLAISPLVSGAPEPPPNRTPRRVGGREPIFLDFGWWNA